MNTCFLLWKKPTILLNYKILEKIEVQVREVNSNTNVPPWKKWIILIYYNALISDIKILVATPNSRVNT